MASSALRGQKVLVMGLGRHGGGVAAARYCAQAGAIVTVTDVADARFLGESIAVLPSIPVENFHLDGHYEEDFHFADLVVVNPAVRPGNRFVETARRAGARITSETELFLDACPAKVIGVTGTVGKSTTAAMLAEILKIAGRRTWLGGNIGHSLLGDLPAMQSDDVVVLELSSFQLHWLSENARWPQGAIITNCSPNHLDWHGGWDHYVQSKQRLTAHAGFTVVSPFDTETGSWPIAKTARRVFASDPGKLPALKVPGEHNRSNAALAAAAARELGAEESAIREALVEFTGLPHRLQFVAEISGRRFYNDSKSTSPAATIAALAAMDRPTWLLLGGADAAADFRELAKVASKTAKGIGVFGATTGKLESALEQPEPACQIFRTNRLADALAWCIEKSRAGEAILLSPACPSTDQFADFADRGEQFCRIVRDF